MMIPDQVINKIFLSLYFPGSLVDKDDTNKLTTNFVNFNKTLLAYLLAKAINHLAMLLAQQNMDVIPHFYMLTYYSSNDNPEKKCTVVIVIPIPRPLFFMQHCMVVKHLTILMFICLIIFLNAILRVMIFIRWCNIYIFVRICNLKRIASLNAPFIKHFVNFMSF